MTPFMVGSHVVKILSAVLTPDGIYGGLDSSWRNEFRAADRSEKVVSLEHIIFLRWGENSLESFLFPLVAQSDCACSSTPVFTLMSLGSLAWVAEW